MMASILSSTTFNLMEVARRGERQLLDLLRLPDRQSELQVAQQFRVSASASSLSAAGRGLAGTHVVCRQLLRGAVDALQKPRGRPWAAVLLLRLRSRLKADMCEDLIAWWSTERARRIDWIRKGLSDGTLL